jgi:peptidoglycan/LPS O-acetylase OafA/YrhL
LQITSLIEAGPSRSRQEQLSNAINSKLIPGLDALRALAILLVLEYHFNNPLHGEIGPMGVEVFFVLSGFLITGILLKEYSRSGTIRLSEFYKRRAFRIFPTFYVCWILTTLFMVIDRVPVEWWQAGASFFYLADYARAIFGDAGNKHMGISWSLAVEEQFYLLWPLILRTALKKGVSASSLAGGIALTVCIYRFVLYFGLGVPDHYIYNAFDTRIDALMVGSALAIECKRDQVKAGLLLPLKSPWLVAVPAVALSAILISAERPGWIGWRWLLSLSVEPVLVAILLIQVVYWGNLRWTLLQDPLIRYLAKISYALYLYHAFALEVVSKLPLEHNKKVIAAVATVTLAMLSFRLVEKPFMRMRDKKRQTPAIV